SENERVFLHSSWKRTSRGAHTLGIVILDPSERIHLPASLDKAFVRGDVGLAIHSILLNPLCHSLLIPDHRKHGIVEVVRNTPVQCDISEIRKPFLPDLDTRQLRRRNSDL